MSPPGPRPSVPFSASFSFILVCPKLIERHTCKGRRKDRLKKRANQKEKSTKKEKVHLHCRSLSQNTYFLSALSLLFFFCEFINAEPLGSPRPSLEYSPFLPPGSGHSRGRRQGRRRPDHDRCANTN